MKDRLSGTTHQAPSVEIIAETVMIGDEAELSTETQESSEQAITSKAKKKRFLCRLGWLSLLLAGIFGVSIGVLLFYRGMMISPEGITERSSSQHSALQKMADTVSQLQTTIEEKSQQILSLSEKIDHTEKETAQAVADLSLQMSVMSERNIAGELTAFEKKLQLLADQNQIILLKMEQAQPEKISLLLAAHALQEAVDRGGPYRKTFELLQSLAPQDLSLDQLKHYADTGLPTTTSLAKEFSKIADRMVEAGNKLPESATMGEKLWSTIESLIVTRPVGAVTEKTVGGSVARIEVAISEANFSQALQEWQTLPPEIKKISADFIKRVQARYDIDKILTDLIYKNSVSEQFHPIE